MRDEIIDVSEDTGAWWHQLENEQDRRGYEEWLDNFDSETQRQENEMDTTKFAESKSNDLKAKEFIGKNLKVKIAGVTAVHFEAKDGQEAQDKLRLTFVGKEKGLVLNATNTQELSKAYGFESDDWIGHEIGLTVKDYSDKGFPAGWVVTPLDVKAPDFNDDIPFE